MYKIGNIAIEKLDPKPGEKILDIGCGIGNLSAVIAKKVLNQGSVIGVDVDPNMIKVANETIKSQDLQNLTVFETNASILDYRSEFDAAFSNIVIHWIKDIEGLFKNLFSSLKNDSRIMIATIFDDAKTKTKGNTLDNEDKAKQKDVFVPEEDKLTQILKIEIEMTQFFVQRGHYKDILTIEEFMAYQVNVDKNMKYMVYTPDKLTEMLEKVGFKDISIEQNYYSDEMDDLEKYFEYRESNLWTFFLSYFPKKHRKAIVTKLRTLILEKWNTIPEEKREFPIKIKWPVLYIKATK